MSVEIVVDQVESGETANGTRYTYAVAQPGKPEMDNPYEPSPGEFELLELREDADGVERPALIAWTPETD